MFTKKLILEYADKLLIGLSDEEVDMLLKEFDVINQNMEKINEIKGLENINPAHFPQDCEISALRDGNEERMIDIDKALSNCDKFIDREVEVPKVVE